MQGTFAGITVRTGSGGGLASSLPIDGTRSTYFQAARLNALGDTVLATTRVFDPDTRALQRLELRAFAASAPARSAIVELDDAELRDAAGAFAYAVLQLSRPGDASDERDLVRLMRCITTDAVPTADAARELADWMRRTWETELLCGAWPAVTGTLGAFGDAGDTGSEWAHAWLISTEHRVEHDDERTFLKVLSTAWLNIDEPADASRQETTA